MNKITVYRQIKQVTVWRAPHSNAPPMDDKAEHAPPQLRSAGSHYRLIGLRRWREGSAYPQEQATISEANKFAGNSLETWGESSATFKPSLTYTLAVSQVPTY
ncbi:hypothetical protein NO559_10450 [Dasania sp. GY-MA-18]|uniref:Uncharacterized protein n=1 Tax=Dasania phycosphaerae TaxID=2950436 RepID=A0A9J6RM80_9GAMM|nr:MULTISPECIES: hypothetical protein [Dasania]MCR8923195.1 hypothetical protein [Dasania sp. GY-MA-18]MCZ0865627.1 hypothetical protein [Dasania phycosphaerae]MCZ0869352.1 hypothetical protein [Dasania phycosphaerae]